MPKTVEELERELAEARQRERDLQSRTLPAEQRQAFLREQELIDRQRELDAREARMQEQAKQIVAQRIHNETGMEIEKLLEAETPDAMNLLAYNYIREQTADPAKLRGLADMLEKVTGAQTQTGNPAAPGAPAPAAPAAAAAPGVVAEPPKVGGPTVPASAPSAGDEFIEANKGKGMQSIAGFLSAIESAPPAAIPGGAGESLPAPETAPAPAPTQASPAPVAAPAAP